MYIAQAQNLYKKLYLQPVIPYSQEEVLRFEKTLGIGFPVAYKEFLLWMGKNARNLFSGSDFLPEDLEWIQDVSRETLREDAAIENLQFRFIFRVDRE